MDPFYGASYDIGAVGIEGGQEAVVRISGAHPLFSNPVASPTDFSGAGYLGMDVTNKGLSIEHQKFDEELVNAARAAGFLAGGTFIGSALKGAGYGMAVAGPWGAVGGLVIGGFVGYGAYFLLERDHRPPEGHFEKGYIDRHGVPRMAPTTAPIGSDDAPVSYASRQGNNVVQMAA
ncbi:hypothetical protein RBA41_07115 [Massilia sp. CCM 9210]|uniref:hypothetical protein n=1 Tax=Massilia scottii TaxID=3057166 RepID=UPI002796C286|nr:hypothetical protein [Massilia sp. CCM 9210]MDQ1813073.1 hypothetical protein [Massilia sp. CCM 9210]